MSHRLAPGYRLKRQMALFGRASFEAPALPEHLRMRAGAACRVAGCGQAAGASGLLCTGHYFAMPAADARFLARLEAAQRRAGDPETSKYLAEQIDGYATQFARRVAGENRA